MERVKKEIRKRQDHLTELNLNNNNLMKEINCWVISVLQKEGFCGKQSSNQRFYSKRNEGGKALKSFKYVCDETKTRVACYMAAAINEWIGLAQRKEIQSRDRQI